MDEETKLNKEKAEARKGEGNAEFAAKNHEGAIAKYSEAISLDGSNHVYFSNRSAVYLELKKYPEAAADAQKCIELNASFIKGYYRLALAQLEQAQHDEAIATIRKGLKAQPGNTELGRLLRNAQAKKSGIKAGRQNRPGQPTPEMIELAEKMNKTKNDLGVVGMQMQVNGRDQKRNNLTCEHLKTIPAGTNTYRAVGKMFMLQPKEEIAEYLTNQTAQLAESAAAFEVKKQYLQRRMASHEANWKDLMAEA